MLKDSLAPPVKGERASLLARGLFLKKGGCQLADRGVAFQEGHEVARGYFLTRGLLLARGLF